MNKNDNELAEIIRTTIMYGAKALLNIQSLQLEIEKDELFEELKKAFEQADQSEKWSVNYKEEIWFAFPFSDYEEDRDGLG